MHLAVEQTLFAAAERGQPQSLSRQQRLFRAGLIMGFEERHDDEIEGARQQDKILYTTVSRMLKRVFLLLQDTRRPSLRMRALAKDCWHDLQCPRSSLGLGQSKQTRTPSKTAHPRQHEELMNMANAELQRGVTPPCA